MSCQNIPTISFSNMLTSLGDTGETRDGLGFAAAFVPGVGVPRAGSVKKCFVGVCTETMVRM